MNKENEVARLAKKLSDRLNLTQPQRNIVYAITTKILSEME